MKSLTIALFSLVWTFAPTHAADITVVGLAGMTPLMKELGSVFERQTGHKLVLRFGSGAESSRIIGAGEAFDVAVLNPPLIKAFIDQGKLARGTDLQLFRNGVGVVVRAGAPKPDISNSEAFKATVLKARSVAYSPGRASGNHVEKVLAQFGILDEVKEKTKAQATPDTVAKAVADGKAELGFAAMNLLTGVAGTTVVGPFPDAIQDYIVFTAGLSANANDAEAARAFIAFLQSETAKVMMRAQGLEPIGPQPRSR